MYGPCIDCLKQQDVFLLMQSRVSLIPRWSLSGWIMPTVAQFPQLGLIFQRLVRNPLRPMNPVHWMEASWQRSSGLRTTICWIGSEAPCLCKKGMKMCQDCKSVSGHWFRYAASCFLITSTLALYLEFVLTTQVPNLQVVRHPLAKLDTMPLRKTVPYFIKVFLIFFSVMVSSHAFLSSASWWD